MKTDKYIARTYDRENNAYIEEYYSGPDVTIKINDKTVEGLSSIQFSVQEQLKPLYSYGSSQFNDVAVGNRIITGALIVPLKNEQKNYNFPSVTELNDTSTESMNQSSIRPGWANNSEINNSAYYLSSKIEIENKNKSTKSMNYELIFSEEIEKAQRELIVLGYKVYINGYLDIYTSDALLKYQKENGLYITGTLTDETKQVLFNKSKSNLSIDTFLKSAPDENSEIITKLNANTPIKIIKEINNYYFIITNDYKYKGYINVNTVKI